MKTIKAGKPLVELARLCYEANRSPLLIGHHGVGKSEILATAAAEMKIGFISLDLSVMEPPELIGLPYPDGPITRYRPPATLPKDGKGLIVFEELNRCPRYMRAPCLQLLTARAINEYSLPQGWLPAAAINPPDGEYEVDELDAALRSRFTEIGVEPDRDEWLAWGRNHGVHPAVLRYVESDPTVFDQPQSNPRAWKYVSDLVNVQSGYSREVLRVAVVGQVGEKRAASFLKTLKDGVKVLTADEILVSYPTHQSFLKTCVKGGQLDMVRSSLLGVLKRLQSSKNFEAVLRSHKKKSNLRAFLGDLPGDLREEAETFFHDHEYKFSISA